MNSGTTGGANTRRLVLAGLAASVLAGCATTGGGAAGPAAQSDSGYVPGADYHVIMAEIAAGRGAEATAIAEYLNAAERSEDPEVSRRAAVFGFEYGFDADALRAARRWSQLAPGEASAHLYVARLLVRRNDVAGATREAGLALGPDAGRAPEDYQLLADEFAGEENAEAVTRLLSRLIARAPDAPALRLTLGAAALRSRDYDLAVESARAALAGALAGAPAGDLAGPAGELLGRALFARGDSEEGLDAMAAAAAADPALDVELERAGMLATANRPDEALAALDDIAKRHGDDPAVRRLRGVIALNADDLDAAWEQFGGLVDDEEFGDESCFYLGSIAVREQRFEQALALFARVGEGPYLMPAQDTISRIAEASGDPQSGLEVLERLGRIYPKSAFEAARYRAAMLERLGRKQEALDLLDQVARYRPDDAGLLLARGALLEKMGRIDDAIADMEAAVRILPDNALVQNALGYTLVNRTSRRDDAYRLIRRAVERDASSGAILDSYGWVLYKQGRLPESRSYLSLAHAQLPDPEVAAHLGEVMWKQGDKDAARKVWADALEKDPSSEPLKDTVARFLK